jgi:glycosyltransferase involved in cell wall biosynthesis
VTRVGFITLSNDAKWLGGVSYFRNLLGALTDFPDPRVEPVMLVGSANAALPPGFERVRSKALPALRKGSMSWFCRRLAPKILVTDRILQRALAAADIQVLSHSGHLGRQTTVATLAWIPDFQHQHLPDFFPPNVIATRNREYMRQCQYATRIIVSSNAAQRDLAEFNPPALIKSRVLRFVADIPEQKSLPSRASIQNRYALPEQYFLLPNQFWMHKNHAIVLDALRILRGRGKPAVVVATGNSTDYRQPAHFQSLMRYSREHGLDADFRVLGVVPFNDLMALMWSSVAVINPSRFEGWSTSVEEGKSMGKKIILSAIPVHLEQAPTRASYFDPDDSERLADLMSESLAQWDPGREAVAHEQAARELPSRRLGFARTYQDCVIDCVK